MHPNSESSGFTIIELLVSVSIFSIIAIVLFSSFRGGVNSWRRVNSELAYQQKIRYAFDKMGRDIRNMVFISTLPFKGSSEEMRFLSIAESKNSQGRDVASVAYHLSREDQKAAPRLLRSQEPLDIAFNSEVLGRVSDEEDKTRPAEKKGEKLLDGIVRLKFKYMSAVESSDDEESVQYEWLEVWEAKEVLPVGVRIDITLRDAEGGKNITLRKSIYVPVGRPQEEEAEDLDSIGN
ncbi:MAG: prepilin-type N-terminal cleavage/methylation domain-containing protein [Candidatus Omnitrophica bacterium]|nr:prepilin-type N-terminal cleavage/methylation domain-containing protein [Candidatus Omnitrophota bacterium]